MDNKKNILLVEDEAITALAEAEMLSGHGYKVTTAGSGRKAVEAVKHDPDISMVLMDINLGRGIDGTQAAEEILKIRELPIVFLTSHSEKEMVDRVKNITSYGYILKNSGEFVLIESISMAYELFNAHQNLKIDIEKRKKTEEALRASEEMFRSIFENSTAGVALVGLDGRYKMVNPAFCKIFGYTEEELLTIDFYKITHPDDVDLSRNTLQNVLDSKGKSVRFSKRYIHKDGHTIWTEVSSTVIYDVQSSPAYFVTHILDVTEKIKAEESLKKSEERYRLIADVTTDYFFKLLVNENGETVMEYVSDNFSKITGRTPEEVNSISSWEKIFHPDDFPRVLKFLERILQTGETDSMEFRSFVRGNMRWINILANPQKDPLSGKVNIIIGAVKDISGRKNAEEALRESEERYRFLFDNSQVGIFRSRLEDGKILECNDFYARHAGYASIEECCNDFIAAEHYVQPEVRALMFKELMKKGSIENYDIQMTKKDGTPVWVSFSAKAYPEEGFLIGVVIDITGRKKTEEALHESEERFKFLFNNTQVGIFRARLEDGKILECNDFFAHHAGYKTVEECCNDYVTSEHYLHPEERSLLINELLKKGSIENNDIQITKKDGTPVWVSFSSRIYPEKGFLIGVEIDITERKAVEEQLMNTKAMLETAFMQTPVPMVLVSAPDYIIRISNPASREFLGVLDEPDHLGESLFQFKQTWQDYDAEGNAKPINEMPLALALEGVETKNMEFFVKRKDGSIRWESVTASPVRNKAGEIIAAYLVFPDITSRKTAEEKLQYQAYILDNINDAVISSDKNFIIRSWNRAAEDIYGWKEEEVIGRGVNEILKSEFKEPQEDVIRSFFKKGIWKGEVIHHRRDGTPVSILGSVRLLNDETDNAAVIISANRDITEQKKAEEALFREQEKSRLYLDIVPSIILVLDYQGNISLINEQGCRMLECVQSEIIGKNWFDTFIPEKNRGHDKKIFKQLMDGEVEPVIYLENIILTRRGRERLMLWHNSVIKDESGHNTGAVASAEDITERKKAENEIRILLEERELLLTEVHHRIKNDMNIISSMLAIQANSSREPAIKTELLETQARINVMFNVYNELYKGKNFTVIPLKPLIIDLIKNIQYLFSVMNHINVDIDIDDININRKISFPVGMIVNEAITNTFKYAFSKKDDKNKITISVKKIKNKDLFISVSDNGKGFPENVLNKSTAGFGFKLIEMLSRQINGEAKFYNNNGAVFELSVPLED